MTMKYLTASKWRVASVFFLCLSCEHQKREIPPDDIRCFETANALYKRIEISARSHASADQYEVDLPAAEIKSMISGRTKEIYLGSDFRCKDKRSGAVFSISISSSLLALIEGNAGAFELWQIWPKVQRIAWYKTLSSHGTDPKPPFPFSTIDNIPSK